MSFFINLKITPIIIPIPKPGKDHSDPNSYRPIALTSCICKTMERMVYELLMWQLDMLGALSSFQCGFRNNRSTVDHLIRLETYIRSVPHIKNLTTICQKGLDVLKVVSGTHWGADKNILLCLYKALIWSKLDYACIVYDSARHSFLGILDPIHHQGLHICLCAFRTSPK